MPDERFRLSYMPALDGIRGIAILFVTIYHISLFAYPFTFFPGGFLGVEMFFVLSGFLITSILIKEFDTYGHISFRNFYIRRFLRLFPALAFMLIILNIFTFLFHNAEAENTLKTSFTTLLYVSNWVYAFNILTPVYLGHTWSLAIEEQFYLIFPLLLITLLRFLSKRRVIQVIAGLSLLSWLWMIVLTSKNVSMMRIYYGLDTRLDGLLMGSVTALLLSSAAFMPLKRLMMRSRNVASILALVSCLIFLKFNMISEANSLLTYYIILPLIIFSVCFIILYFVTIETTLIKSFFELKPLVFLGKISYGFYLWHCVCYTALFHVFHLSTLNMAIVGTILALAATLFSYRYVEGPMLRLKSHFESHPEPAAVQSTEARKRIHPETV